MKTKLMLAWVAGWLAASTTARASVSVIIEPPLSQPPAVAIAWAPPPMLVDVPPPIPFDGAMWIGGYWTWDGDWVWATGRWGAPPESGWVWTVPYYEHRGAQVVFVDGFWARPGVAFVPPPLGVSVTVARPGPGVVVGPPPLGPAGVFVPPPPGSRPGVIVHAPIGTPPAVVVSAPPVVRPGMTVHPSGHGHFAIEAPAGVTRGGAAVRATVPARAHLAASLPSHVHALATHLAATHNFALRGAPMHSTPTHSAPMHSQRIDFTPHAAHMPAAPMHAAPAPPPRFAPPPPRAARPRGHR